MSDIDDIFDDIAKNGANVPTDHPPKKQPVSKSQRLRFVLYGRWEKSAMGIMPFQQFYDREMDRITAEESAKIP